MTIGRAWTDEELQILRDMYPMTHTDVIAERLGRSEDTIRSKAHKLGIKKASDYDYAGNYGKYVHKGQYRDAKWGTAKH